MKKINTNKGQGNIITVVLIILVVLAMIVIIWALVSGLLKDKSGLISIDEYKINLVIESAFIPVANDGMKVTLHRLGGSGDINSIIFILEDDSGSSYLKEVENPIPNELETMTYEMSDEAYPLEPPLANFVDISKVSIVITFLDDSGDKRQSQIKDVYTGNFREPENDLDETLPPGSLCGNDECEGPETCDSNVCVINGNIQSIEHFVGVLNDRRYLIADDDIRGGFSSAEMVGKYVGFEELPDCINIYNYEGVSNEILLEMGVPGTINPNDPFMVFRNLDDCNDYVSAGSGE